MEALGYLRTVLRHPSLLRPYRPLLLLSHMRATTSLLGHILGENPEIDGYYELHIGYHSWRSLVRQKLIYFESHAPKSTARFMFDKVLTNQHWVNVDVLQGGKLIFMLRPPERTIRSIVNLYRNEFPGEQCAEVEGAIEYYVQRLRSLQKISAKTAMPFIYIDSDALQSQTDTVLEAITSYLSLRQPLTREYTTRPLTGMRRAGDSSSNISLGRVSDRQQDYSDIHVDTDMLQPAREIFENLREQLINHPMAANAVLQECAL